MVYIAEIEHGCNGSYLEVRILRKWIPYFRNKETWFLAVDKQGNTIVILGQQQGQTYLESRLKINKCYGIEQYSCSETAGFQKVIRNTVHLNAGEASRITPLDNRSDIPESWFDFAAIDDLHSFFKTPTHLPDFIGKFKRQGYSNKRNGDRFLLLTLTNTSGQEITITLWKECIENAEKVDLHALSTVTTDSMIAVTNVKPGIFNEILKLSSTDATHMYINPTLPADLREYGQVAAPGRQAPNTVSFTVMTLAELQDKLYDSIQRKTIAVDARIVDTRFDSCWYTATCQDCKSYISKLMDVWFCPNHGKHCRPTFLYNINVTLSDGTRNLEAACTDLCMQKLMGHTCQEIITEQGYEDRKNLPPCFRRQGLDTHRFHVEVTKKSTPTNVKFVIVNRESVPVKSPSSLTMTPVSEQTTSSTTATEMTLTTPPPYTPMTPTTEAGSDKLGTSPTQQHKKPTAAKQLTFQSTETSEAVETQTDMQEDVGTTIQQTRDEHQTTTQNTKLSATGKRKATSHGTAPKKSAVTKRKSVSKTVATATHTKPTLAKQVPSQVTDSEDSPTNTAEYAEEHDETAKTDTESSPPNMPRKTTTTDELEVINPGKRERFPE